MRQGPNILWGMSRSDPSALSGVHLDRGLVRRVWAFARPYRARTFAFLGVIVVEALLGLVTPENIGELMMVQAARPPRRPPSPPSANPWGPSRGAAGPA